MQDGVAPLCAVDLGKLLEQDLDLLAVGRVHGEEVEALVVLDDVGRRIFEEAGVGGHGERVRGCEGAARCRQAGCKQGRGPSACSGAEARGAK